MDVTPGVHDRLVAVEARQSISELLARYAFAFDFRDMDALAPLFTPNAKLVHSWGESLGIDEIVQHYWDRWSYVGPSFHWPHHHHVNFDSDTTASGTVGAHVEMEVEGQTTVAALIYRDRYVESGRSWRFQERVVSFLYAAPASSYEDALVGLRRLRWPGTEPQEAHWPESLETYRAAKLRP